MPRYVPGHECRRGVPGEAVPSSAAHVVYPGQLRGGPNDTSKYCEDEEVEGEGGAIGFDARVEVGWCR